MSEETKKSWDKRIRWQYHRLSCHDISNPETEFFEQANQLGSEGWELISTASEKVTTPTGFSEIYMIGIFKRPVKCYTSDNGELVVDFVI